jgi:hypothetical protein
LDDPTLLGIVIGVPIALFVSFFICGISLWQYRRAKKNGTLPGWLKLPTSSKDHPNYDFDE